MAKAKLGLMKNEGECEFWRVLFDDLKVAVLADKITCPGSEFQRKEARLDSRIEEAVVMIIDELSWGLEFNSYDVILRLQIEDAAFRFLEKSPPPSEPWAIAFNSDPLAPVESRMVDISRIKGRIFDSYSLPDEFIQEDRNRKQEFVDEADEMLKSYSANPLGWSELLLQSKKGVVDGFIGRRARQSIARQLQEDSPLSQLRSLQRHKELEDFWNRLQCIGIDTSDHQKVMEFAESNELLDSPFININGSIWAAIGEYYIQGRNVRRGDFYDAPILAAVLPYCDIVTTDSFMKGILLDGRLRFDRLRFDKKYKREIFSASEADRQAFHKLIRELK
jgi:hypothetical protein